MLWDPTPAEEVLQNVQSLEVLAQGTQPMARVLGMPLSVLDGPEQVAQARIAAALNTQIAAYEPRAKVSKITVARTAEGRLRATVRLR